MWRLILCVVFSVFVIGVIGSLTYLASALLDSGSETVETTVETKQNSQETTSEVPDYHTVPEWSASIAYISETLDCDEVTAEDVLEQCNELFEEHMGSMCVNVAHLSHVAEDRYQILTQDSKMAYITIDSEYHVEWVRELTVEEMEEFIESGE